MVKEIDIGSEFSDYLVNRNKLQGDGSNTAEEFRTKFLADLEDDDWWNNPNTSIILNFENVRTLGPSWANEVFAYYASSKKKDTLLKKIQFKNISVVKKEIINTEIQSGYAEYI